MEKLILANPIQCHWLCTSNTIWNLKTDAIEVALMVFLNAKVSAHEEAELDILVYVVHIKEVDNRNVSRNHCKGSHHQSRTMTAYWQECSSCENYVRPHSAAVCSGYFKAFAPRDINNIYLGKTAPTQTFHIWFFKRKTSNRLTNISQSFIVFLDFITVWDWFKWALSNYTNVKYDLLKMILK